MNQYKQFILESMSLVKEPKIRLAKNVTDSLPHESACVILSIAFILDVDPNIIWAAAKKYWRVGGGITNAHKPAILRELGYESKSRYDLSHPKKKDKVFNFSTPTATNLGSLLKILDTMPSTDMFLVDVSNHTIGVKNRKVLDTDNTGDRKKIVHVTQVSKG